MTGDFRLKIYLFASGAFFLIFTLSFFIGLYTLDSMRDLYGATLPFLGASGACLVAFGFAPQSGAQCRSNAVGNVVSISTLRAKRRNGRYESLRKIS